MEDTPEEAAWRRECLRRMYAWLEEVQAGERRYAELEQAAAETYKRRQAEELRERKEQERYAERMRRIGREQAGREAAEAYEGLRREALAEELSRRKAKERQELERLDAIWANDLRLLEEDEAGPFRLNYALRLEAGSQQNLERLAAMEMTRLAASVMIDTPFSQLRLIPANAWAPTGAWTY